MPFQTDRAESYPGSPGVRSWPSKREWRALMVRDCAVVVMAAGSQESVLLIRSASVAVSRTNLSPVSELVVDLERDRGDALHRQIETSIRERIRSGALAAGVALPPTRALAAELGVSRGV